MKTTIKFFTVEHSIMRFAPLMPLLGHNVPVFGWSLQLYTPPERRGGGWYLFEEDETGDQTGEALHFARHAEAVSYARRIYDNGGHLARNYRDEVSS